MTDGWIAGFLPGNDAKNREIFGLKRLPLGSMAPIPVARKGLAG